MKDKIKFIHITTDSIFFDGVISAFDSDDRIENKSICIVSNTHNNSFNFIKCSDKILLLNKREAKKYLRESDYDVVYIHGLSRAHLNCIPDIHKHAKIIWWEWGFDVYYTSLLSDKKIPINLYKPITEKVLNKENFISKRIKSLCFSLTNLIYRRYLIRCLSRIDYIQPVLSIEYKLLKYHNPYLQAKEFYMKSVKRTNISSHLSNSGNILFGNSSTYTNNHLDIWEKLKTLTLGERKILMPISYGDKNLRDILVNRIAKADRRVNPLLSFMPKEEYLELMDSCSYAIFGVLRQQAMGNIHKCLLKGIKVFLYKDSIPYKYLKENGYIVFTIEEMNSDSLNNALSQSEIECNHLAYQKERNRRNAIYEQVISSLKNG